MESLSSDFVLELYGYVEENNPDKSKEEWVLDCSVLEDEEIYDLLEKLQNVIVFLINDLPEVENELFLPEVEYFALILVKMKISFLESLAKSQDVNVLRGSLSDKIHIGMVQEFKRQTPDRFKDLPLKARISILEGDIVAEDLLRDTRDFVEKVLPDFN